MLIVVEDLLPKEQVAQCRRLLDNAEWVDGKVTAGTQSSAVKHNKQLPEGSPVAAQLGDMILDALARNGPFISAALPLRIFPPLFNRYQGGEHFGTHVDNAIRAIPGTAQRIRTDLSCTLFFSEPQEYDGGELVVEGQYGAQEVKLPAGSMVLYPSSSLHHVTPVTRGVRVSSFFWMQSMIRDNEKRSLLYDFDRNIQALSAEKGSNDPVVLSLSGLYHNLIRQWVEM